MTQTFAYRAMSAEGAIRTGVIDAGDRAEAYRAIASEGLFLISIELGDQYRTHRQVLSSSDLALGLRILGDLLASGLPISRALHAFQDLAPRGWKPAVPTLIQSVREGNSLASAMATAPVEIPQLTIGIVQAGEAGAGIGPAIQRAAELAEQSADMRSAVRSALAYPMIVAVAGLAAIVVLLTVVLPRFARILADLGQTLPASTRIVLEISRIGKLAMVPVAVAVVVLFAGWRYWTRTAEGRRAWDRLLLSLPLVSSVRTGTGTARMAHALAALLESGIPIGPALAHAGRATDNAELEFRIRQARDKIAAGASLSNALEEVRAVALTAVRLIRAGEESGRVASMLLHAAHIEQKRVDQIVKTAVRMLEPVLLLTFASMVALVAAALLQAIYSVRPT